MRVLYTTSKDICFSNVKLMFLFHVIYKYTEILNGDYEHIQSTLCFLFTLIIQIIHVRASWELQG